jgi:breast cancer metastasis-suppressor 1-like protein
VHLVKVVYYLLFRLYRERITQIEAKLSEVRTGKSVEYLQPLEELQVNMKNRMEVGSVLRELRLANINCKFDAEVLASEQNFQVSANPVFM